MLSFKQFIAESKKQPPSVFSRTYRSLIKPRTVGGTLKSAATAGVAGGVAAGVGLGKVAFNTAKKLAGHLSLS